MSDDLRKAIQEMRHDLAGVKEGLDTAARRFDNFLARFDEAMEMLVTHDNEQLQRVAAVERQNDVLLEKYGEVLRRVEALENKAG